MSTARVIGLTATFVLVFALSASAQAARVETISTVAVTVNGSTPPTPAIFFFTFDQDLEGWEPSCLLNSQNLLCHNSPTSAGRVRLTQFGSSPGRVVELDGGGDPGTPDAWISKSLDLPSNVTTLQFYVGAHNRDGADARFVVRIVDANGSTTLLDQVVTGTATDTPRILTGRSLSIAAWAGRRARIFFEQDDNGFVDPDTGIFKLPGGNEQIYVDNIRIQ